MNDLIVKDMETIVITPRSQKSIPFLRELLTKLSDVKHIEVISSKTKNNIELHKEIDAGLKEVRDIIDGKKQAKSFEQFLDEI